MIKPFLLLQRVVPGWESRALSRGPLPEKLTIGPWSSLYAGGRGNNAANPPWADQEVPGPRPKGNVLVTSGGTMRSDGRYDKTREPMISQLTFFYQNTTVKLPRWLEGNETPLYHKAMMLRSTCGIDATYYNEGIAQFVAVNAKNESEVWMGHHLPMSSCHGGYCKALTTGTGLCGLYIWHGISKIQSSATTSGQAFEMEFIFSPEV